jgi:HSP20 family protein
MDAPSRHAEFAPAVDIVEQDKAYAVYADLPGVNGADIDVQVENGLLTITAPAPTAPAQAGRYLRRERAYGPFARSFRLGKEIDPASIQASYRDGVLQIVLAKADTLLPKKIAIDVS